MKRLIILAALLPVLSCDLCAPSLAANTISKRVAITTMGSAILKGLNQYVPDSMIIGTQVPPSNPLQPIVVENQKFAYLERPHLIKITSPAFQSDKQDAYAVECPLIVDTTNPHSVISFIITFGVYGANAVSQNFEINEVWPEGAAMTTQETRSLEGGISVGASYIVSTQIKLDAKASSVSDVKRPLLTAFAADSAHHAAIELDKQKSQKIYPGKTTVFVILLCPKGWSGQIMVNPKVAFKKQASDRDLEQRDSYVLNQTDEIDADKYVGRQTGLPLADIVYLTTLTSNPDTTIQKLVDQGVLVVKQQNMPVNPGGGSGAGANSASDGQGGQSSDTNKKPKKPKKPKKEPN